MASTFNNVISHNKHATDSYIIFTGGFGSFSMEENEFCIS